MTVRTDQLLLRQNYTVNKWNYARYNKSIFVLLRLQVKSILSLHFFFPKKRFFFNQFFSTFNCFNKLIHNNIFLNLNNRQKFFFSGQNKYFMINRSVGNLNLFNKFNSMPRGPYRKQWNFLSTQMFYILIKYHRLYSTPVFGLMPRYKRYLRFLKTHDLLLHVNSVSSRFKNNFNYKKSLRRAFYLKYKRLKELSVSDVKTISVLQLRLKRIVFFFTRLLKDRLFYHKRFINIYKPFFIPQSVFNIPYPFSLFTHKKFLNFGWSFIRKDFIFAFNCNRRRLLFFSGKLYLSVVARYRSIFFFYKNSANLLFYDFLQLDSSITLFFFCKISYWFCSLLAQCGSAFFLRNIFVNFFFMINVAYPIVRFNISINKGLIFTQQNVLLIRWWQRWFYVWKKILLKVLLQRLQKFRLFFSKFYSSKKAFKRHFSLVLFRTAKIKGSRIINKRSGLSHNYMRRTSFNQFFKVRLNKLIVLYSNLRRFSAWFKQRQSTKRRRLLVSWDVYVDMFSRYKDLTFLNKTWLFFLRKVKTKKNTRFKLKKIFRLIRFSSLWGYRFRRFFFRTRHMYLRHFKRMYKTSLIRNGNLYWTLKVQNFFFVLSMRRFTQLFIKNRHKSFNTLFFHYKFYSVFIKKINQNFVLRRKRFWLDSKLIYFRRIRLLIRRDLRKRVRGYRSKLNFLRMFSYGAKRSLTFYSLFKRRIGRHSFSLFFCRGLEALLVTPRKLRRIKRKLHLANFKVLLWNKITLVQLSLLKVKRKPFSLRKIKRFAPITQMKVYIQKQKMYSRLYQILSKFLLSYRMTSLWLSFRSLVIFFNIKQIFLLNRYRLRRLLYLVRSSFYLRYYKNKASFLNSLLFTIISMYYRAPMLLNEVLCSNLKRLWKHRTHIFDTFKLISAVLWRVSFKNMSSSLNVKTVFMQINGKVNSGTRTKHFKLRIDYKPSFVTLKTALSFNYSTAEARTGVFGVQTWYGY